MGRAFFCALRVGVNHPSGRFEVAFARLGLAALGSRVRAVPNHVCVAVNLVDEVAVVRGGELVDRWQVAARGRPRQAGALRRLGGVQALAFGVEALQHRQSLDESGNGVRVG